MPLDPEHLYASLLAAGISDFAGVPCSILDPLIARAEASPELRYLRASVEGEAVAASCGVWLAGGLGAVLMQNSGLGNAVNPLASLAIPYQIPLLLLVSWRGEPGVKDAVHHFPMGRATRGLLDLLDIPVTTLREGSDVAAAVAEACLSMEKQRRPAALLIPRGLFARAAPGTATQGSWRGPPADAEASVVHFAGGGFPSRAEVISAFLTRWGHSATIATTGYTSRELEASGAHPWHFPMQGSMGFAPAIALGVTRVQQDREIFVLDGDGALLMRLGGLASIGASRPHRLVHVVLDNGSYASTGGQPTISSQVDFTRVALACGYPRVAICSGQEQLAEALDWAAAAQGGGPSLLRIAIDQWEGEARSRPERTPPEIAASFRSWLAGSSN